MTKKSKVYIVAIGLSVAVMIAVVLISCFGKPAEQPAEAPLLSDQAERVVYKEVEKEKLVQVEVEKVITSEILEDGLREMGFLITQEYFFTEAINFSSVKKLFNTVQLPFTESSFLATYDGDVQAGIDFTKVSVEKNDALKTITVTIPKAEIHSVTVDTESFVLYDEKEGLGNKISLKDYNASLLELQNTAEKKAVERGVLDRANENAKQVIANFIGSLVDTKEFVVDYKTR